MRMLEAILTTKKIALRGDFFAYIKKKHYLCSRNITLCVSLYLLPLESLKPLLTLETLESLKTLLLLKQTTILIF